MIRILNKNFLYNLPNELLFKICSHLTSHELYQLSLSCQALSRIACEVLSRALILDYAYHDDRKLPQVNEIVNKLKRRSIGFLSDITIAHFSWPVSSQLYSRMRHILSLLPNLQTLYLREQCDSLQGYFIRSNIPECVNTNLYDVLLTSPSASTLRSLTIADSRISSHDILKLFSAPQLEHLSIIGFNYPMGIEPSPSTPYSRLQSLSISTTAQPTGRHIDIVLARVPNLRRFCWKFDFRDVKTKEQFTQVCSPAAISAALKPLRTTLEELRIEMVHTGFRNDGRGLCLVGFKKLRRLRVHEEVLFPSYLELDYEEFWSGLGARLWVGLPKSLEMLEIVSDARRGDQTDCRIAENPTLIFELPASMKMRLRSLNHVVIIR